MNRQNGESNFCKWIFFLIGSIWVDKSGCFSWMVRRNCLNFYCYRWFLQSSLCSCQLLPCPGIMVSDFKLSAENSLVCPKKSQSESRFFLVRTNFLSNVRCHFCAPTTILFGIVSKCSNYFRDTDLWVES